MAMNPQPEENPQAAATSVEPQPAAPTEPQPTVQTEPQPTAPAEPQPTAPAEPQPPEQSAEKDQQVVDAVAQGLADDEITAEDIMTAVLSDALGITPQGAQSLFRLLMSELVDEEETQKKEVPPQEGV